MARGATAGHLGDINFTSRLETLRRRLLIGLGQIFISFVTRYQFSMQKVCLRGATLSKKGGTPEPPKKGCSPQPNSHSLYRLQARSPASTEKRLSPLKIEAAGAAAKLLSTV